MSDIFSIIGCVGVVIYFVSKHSEALAKLNKIQKIGVLISYIMTTLIAGICIYYGSCIINRTFSKWISYISHSLHNSHNDTVARYIHFKLSIAKNHKGNFSENYISKFSLDYEGWRFYYEWRRFFANSQNKVRPKYSVFRR